MTGSILVTGGAGFVGSHLCERLLDDGERVICLDNFLSSPGSANVRHLVDNPRFSLVEADICEAYQPKESVQAVLHLASPASPVAYQEHPIETLRVGSVGTMNALEIARAAGAVFLLASTSEVYGDPDVHPQPEDYRGNVSPIGPRSMYDEAKRFAEAATMAYHHRHGVRVRIARIFNTYGPRMDPNDGRAIPSFVTAALTGRPLTVYGDGSQTRSLCFVDDTVEGLLALLASDAAEPVNIGNADERSILDLARAVLEVTRSDSPIELRPLPVDDPRVRCPDTTRAREVLGWQARVPLSEGLRATVEWFRRSLGLDVPVAHAG